MDRKQIRLKEYDYNTPGAYFITICTQGRKNILCDVVGNDNAKIELTETGKIVNREILNIETYYNNINK